MHKARVIALFFTVGLIGLVLTPSSQATEPNTHVWLKAENSGGYSCMVAYDGFDQCTLALSNIYYTQHVQVNNESSQTLYIYPNDNYRIDTIRLGLLDANQNLIEGSDQIFQYNGQSFVFSNLTYTWDQDGYLVIPVGISNLEIQLSYEIIPNVVELNSSLNGQICLLSAGIDPYPCSSEANATVEYNAVEFEPVIEFNPDDHFRLESVSISVSGGPLVTYSIADGELPEGTIFAEDLDEIPYGFSWDEYGRLATPSPAPNFEVSASFIELPPLIQAASISTGEIAFGSDIPFQIQSIDPEFPNNYSDIASIFLTISYTGVDPNNPSNTNARLRCKIQLQNWQPSLDMELLYVHLPELQDFMSNCSGYHITTATTTAEIALYEDEDIDITASYTVAPTQSVALIIPSPPAVLDLLTEGEIFFGDNINLSVSNQINVSHIWLELSADEFNESFCRIVRNLRDSDGHIISSFFDQNENLLIQIPTPDEINTNCSDMLTIGENNIDQNQTYLLSIKALDQYNNYEQYATIEVSISSPTPTPTPSPIPTQENIFIPVAPIIIPEQVMPNQENSNPIQESASSSNSNDEISKRIDYEKVAENARSNSGDTSWCVKKGIWVYTESGKLQMCDPLKSVALEMPACAGKEKTPTYPWIFRAQRFIPGVTPTKSGIDLHNAIFFFKGLAISGSEAVSSKPCSNGSVFIPMQFSKTVFEFAKSQKPLIWVLNK